MTILPLKERQDVRDFAERAFAMRTSEGAMFRLTFSDTPRPEIGAIELYNLPLDSLVRREFDQGQATGWRYVQLRPGADVGEIIEIARSDKPSLRVFARGPLARDMADVANAAEKSVGNATNHYMARIVRLPEIQLEALWLQCADGTDDDKFFGLTPPHQGLRDQMLVEAAIAAATEYLESARLREH